MNLFEDNSQGAEFSPCGKYRYKLWRIWDETKPKAMCIGLNPSTANETKPDPTITNLIKMLKILEYGGFYMTNLFAWISSKPTDLLICPDPMGNNKNILKEVKQICDDVIVCWGNFKESVERSEEVLQQHPNALCFGVNKNGTPMHPLSMMYQGKTNNPKLLKYNLFINN